MGRQSYSNKTETYQVKQISTSFLKKHGFFEDGMESGTVSWSRNGENTGRIGIQSRIEENEKYIKFIYTQTNNDTGEKKDFDYKVQLATTSCHYGGVRHWFVCSLTKNGNYCGRRVGVLYKNGDYFGCRHCYDLVYRSNREECSITSIPELEDLEKNIKRKYYKGNMTRKYKSYLKKEMRNNTNLISFLSKYNNLLGKK